jgi:iron complex outermembrane recepter protein
MPNSNRRLRDAIRIALAAVTAASGGQLSQAQTVPAPTATEASIPEMVVTGSRIQHSPNDISISPITSVTTETIQQSGLLATEDILNSLPQVVANQSSGEAVSSDGTATVSLRGLGPQRTLVLVDGLRLNPGTGDGRNYADLNQIPADLISRIDVLTGGASAVYGADAVAGVVNFVLNTHFEGVKLDANYGFDNHQNNNSQDLGFLTSAGVAPPPSTVDTGFARGLSFVAGKNLADGKGNATVYATFQTIGAAVGDQFDHAGCTLDTPSALTPGAQPHCGGSGTSATGEFTMSGLVKGSPVTLVDNTVDRTTGAFRPFNSNIDAYNFGALSYLQRPSERYTAGVFLHYDLNDHNTLYSESMFSRTTSTSQYGPSGSFFDTATINCVQDPLLTTQERATLCSPANISANHGLFPNNPANDVSFYLGRRNVEGGPRLDSYSSESFREVIGVKGAFEDVWQYDVHGQVGLTNFQDVQGNMFAAPQVVNSLNVVTNPASGQPVCESVLNGSDTACVPWNIWVPGGVTQAALKYLTLPSSYTSTETEYIVGGSITGDLSKYGVKVPSAASGMALNVGAEYRDEQSAYSPDFVYEENYGVAPIAGGFHVAEGFTELRLPILDEKPGAYQLSTEAGYRYSSYSSGFNTNTFKLGVEWAPIRDVRLRGSYNRAIRAPDIGDLYSPSGVIGGGSADPCWGPSPGLSQAQCANTGVTAAQYGHILASGSAQINTLLGGNPDLKPEVADTYSYGIVVQPQAISNLIVSFDYYNIKINNTIESLSSNTIVDNCATTGSAALCSLIHRGPTGSLWLTNADYVQATELNIGTVSTKGFDVTGHYEFNVGWMGKLRFDLTGTHVFHFLTQPLPTGGSYDCAGFWGATCGAPIPLWRDVFTTNWATPWRDLDITFKWRYIGSANVDSSSSNPLLAQAYYPGTANIPAYNYFDMSASILLTSAVSLRLGVNNIADKDPPLVLSGTFSNANNLANDNTWVGTYDTLGRYLYARITAKF